MTIEQTQELVEFIAKESESESSFLTPFPAWTVNSHAFLDKIAEITGIPKKQIGEWVENVIIV